jgi:hypothetical protein
MDPAEGYVNGGIETTLYRYPTRVEGAGPEIRTEPPLEG